MNVVGKNLLPAIPCADAISGMTVQRDKTSTTPNAPTVPNGSVLVDLCRMLVITLAMLRIARIMLPSRESFVVNKSINNG